MIVHILIHVIALLCLQTSFLGKGYNHRGLVRMPLRISSRQLNMVQTSAIRGNEIPLPHTAEVKFPPKNAVVSKQRRDFTCLTSTSADLFTAVNEVISAAKGNVEHSASPQIALVFISSLYENKQTDYDVALQNIQNSFPSLKSIIGSTTSCPIGETGNQNGCSEIDGRHGVSIYFLSFQDFEGNQVTSFQYDDNQLLDFLETAKSLPPRPKSQGNGKITLLFATDNVKPMLLDFAYVLNQNHENMKIIGAFASTVNDLHRPRLFTHSSSFIKEEDTIDSSKRLYSGLVGVTISGDFHVNYEVARSVVPLGPLFRIKETFGNEIVKIEDIETGTVSPPLDALGRVLKMLPSEDSYSLKKELLLAVSPETNDLIQKKTLVNTPFSGIRCDILDPVGGGITIPYRRKKIGLDTISSDHLIQFCKWDKMNARLELEKITRDLKKDHKRDPENTKSLLLLTNDERGVSTFRLQNYESAMLNQAFDKTVPIGGMAGKGVFVFDNDRSSEYGILSTDAVYLTITDSKKLPTDLLFFESEETEIQENLLVSPADVMTIDDKVLLDDETNEIILQKRDPLTSHSVKVGTLDYSIPDKAPKPTSFYESLLWDRDKVVDRLREQYPNTRALQLAKMAIAKYPKTQSFSKYVHQRLSKIKESSIPGIILNFMRSSLNNGFYFNDFTNNEESEKVLRDFIEQVKDLTLNNLTLNNDQNDRFIDNHLIALGCQVETESFKGQYEDLDILKKELFQWPLKPPVICDDFILYAYQVFRAKAHAADVIRLYAPGLSISDLSYMFKTARNLQLDSIVVVSSKEQLLNVLDKIPDLEALSVSSRNFKIWKIDAGKASRILQDSEVVEAIQRKRASNPNFVLFQEGFVDSKEVHEVRSNGVDAIFLGEELLYKSNNITIQDRVRKWFSEKSIV